MEVFPVGQCFMSQQEKINKQFASLSMFYFSNTGTEKENCGTNSNTSILN